MNLRSKKQLASKVLNVGKNKIHFNSLNLNEIKEAITRQDILDLYNQGIITIKPNLGRRKIIKKKTRRGPGKTKQKVNKRKQIYVKITRKLRTYLQELKSKNKINRTTYKDIRKKIKMRAYKSKANLKEYIEGLGDIKTEKSEEKPKKTKTLTKEKKTTKTTTKKTKEKTK